VLLKLEFGLLVAMILLATFVTLAGINATLYALLAERMGRTIRSPRLGRIVNRTGGTLLIGAGFLSLGLKRAIA
jgi:threonine/homoserine/homoserine lactone efflux protein